jgi:ATP-dependent helicase/nuclease subunit B
MPAAGRNASQRTRVQSRAWIIKGVPALKYQVSPSATARAEAAMAFVEGFGPAAEVLVLSAQREAGDDFCRSVAARSGASFGLHRLTLLQYASRAASARLAERGLAPLSPLGSEAVAARTVFEARASGGLSYLAPMVGCPGFPRAVASTLGDLREAGVDRSSLRGLAAPGPDLAALLDEYERQVDRARLADRATLLQTAAESVRERPAESLATLPVVLLDVSLRTAAERQLARAIIDQSPSVLLTIVAGDRATEAFATSIGGTAEASAQGDGDEDLDRIRTHLFAPTTPERPARDGGAVQLISAPGEGREAVEIARRILEETRQGVPLDEIAVVVRLPETYWGLLEHALRRAGVAAWFARGTRRPDPAGRAFLTLIACAVERLSARRFAEYLSLAQVPPLADGEPPDLPAPWVPPNVETPVGGQLSLLDLIAAPPKDLPPDSPGSTLRAPRRWEAFIVESSVIGGADRWARRLGGFAAELRVRLEEARAEEPDSPRARAIARDLGELEALRRFALPVIQVLDVWRGVATWGEWLDRLEALAPRVLRHPRRVLEVLAELRPMGAVGPVSLDEVRAVLQDRLAMLDKEPAPQRYGRVFVCTPGQLRGRSFRVVFVAGLAERVFPQKPRQDPLLLDELRETLDAGLETETDRVANERLLLQLAVGAARERLYLSYPRLDVAQSRPRVPSFYLLEVERARTGRVPDYEQLERAVAQQSSAWLAWPAPVDPARAIDDAEHDLAVLRPLLAPGGDPEAAKGRAHYLLTLNQWLAESLRGRWARGKKAWSRYDGLALPGDAVRAALASQSLRARPYSVSALQRFAACPYQFLLGSIYRFEPFEPPEPLNEMDPLTRGSLFHRVQRDVLRALKGAGLIPLSAERADEARRLLDVTLNAVAADYHDDLAPAIDRVWQDEIERLRLDLRTWLIYLVESADEWEPAYFELSFGLPLDADHDEDSVPDPVTIDEGFKLRGAIDLIERRRQAAGLRVTDHKTGRNTTSSNLIVGGGSTLQPVIYGMVVEELLKQRVVESRLFFATAQGGFETRAVPMADHVRRSGVEVLEIIERAVAAGALPQAPRSRACEWCDFRPVCGPSEERRFNNKDKADDSLVGDLLALRSKR